MSGRHAIFTPYRYAPPSEWALVEVLWSDPSFAVVKFPLGEPKQARTHLLLDSGLSLAQAGARLAALRMRLAPAEAELAAAEQNFRAAQFAWWKAVDTLRREVLLP